MTAESIIIISLVIVIYPKMSSDNAGKLHQQSVNFGGSFQIAYKRSGNQMGQCSELLSFDTQLHSQLEEVRTGCLADL